MKTLAAIALTMKTTEQKIHTIMHSDSESSHESLSDDEVSLSTQTHTASALDTITKHAIQS